MSHAVPAFSALVNAFADEGLNLDTIHVFHADDNGPYVVRPAVELDATIQANHQRVTKRAPTFEEAFEGMLQERDRKLRECPPASGSITLHLSRSLALLGAAVDKAKDVAHEARLMPEGYEHPDLHPAMADRWLQRALTQHVVLGTHSQTFLLRTLNWVAQKKLPPDNVRVWWHEEGMPASEIKVDAQGRLMGGGLPMGLWTKLNEEARGLLLIRR